MDHHGAVSYTMITDVAKDKAQAELGSIGGRATSPPDLTLTEERVAELVTEGQTNREVAASLFLGVKTR